MRERFNRDFWLEEKDVYALALHDGDRPCEVVLSDAGQALWSGIADPDSTPRTMERPMADDMFSCWGIWTLSAKERLPNPSEAAVHSRDQIGSDMASDAKTWSVASRC